MENPNFLPPGDNGEWLDSLLRGLGDEEPKKDEFSDLEEISPEDVEMSRVARQFIAINYPDINLKRPSDMDHEAVRMMGSLASFKARYGFKEGDHGGERIGDIYPDLSVRHVNLGSRFRLREIRDELKTSIPGTGAHGLRLIARTYFGIIRDISNLAMEFESRNKRS